jgi:acetyltransferase
VQPGSRNTASERASALAVLAQRAEYLEQERRSEVEKINGDKASVTRILDARGHKPGFLTGTETSAILKAYQLPDVSLKLAKTVHEAAEYAQEVGFPVVMKVASADITHKSDAGGVMLNLVDQEAVAISYEKILANARAAYPEAVIDGIYVQRMIPPGQEVILGAIQDAQFGAMIMFGSGGVEVEGLKDVAFALAPVTNQDAEWMLETPGRKTIERFPKSSGCRPAAVLASKSLGQLSRFSTTGGY